MIDGKNIVIRALETEDFHELWQMKNEAEIIFWEGHPFSMSYEKFKKIYTGYFESDTVLMKTIVEKETNAIIGTLKIYLDWKDRNVELGITLSKRYWGKGYGTDTIVSATEYLFNWLMIKRVQATILTTNQGSRAMFKKAGFEEEGILRQARVHNGQYTDVVMVSKINNN
ncbi:MAG: GNAT family N-acetyltransferase [Epsilonproteobacteria bacterium]|nr:GNAT family N-acetyltransferase [Campylobacterota bacterium]